MKNLSKAAQLRISANPAIRSAHMTKLATLLHAKRTKAQRRAHALIMVAGRKAKKKLSLAS